MIIEEPYRINCNKLLAKFMGIFVESFEWNEFISLVVCDEDGDYEIDEDLQHYDPSRKWDDLMPIVEKIESLHGGNFSFFIVKDQCDISFSSKYYGDENSDLEYDAPKFEQDKGSKIKATWHSAVKFVEWWNDFEGK